MTCTKDGSGLERQVGAIVSEVKSGMTPTKALDVIKKVGQLITGLPTTLKDCYEVKNDLGLVKAWALNIEKNPTVILANVQKNWDDVGKQLFKIPGDVKAKNYSGSGRDIADLLVDVLGKIGAKAKAAKGPAKKLELMQLNGGWEGAYHMPYANMFHGNNFVGHMGHD